MTSLGLTTRGLTIGYPARIVGRHIDLDIPPGELVALVGPNGAGKTTLLRTLSGLLPPLSGLIEVNGGSLISLSSHQRARCIGVVLTDRVDTGWLTSLDLVATGRYPHTGWGGKLSVKDMAIVDQALRSIGGDDLRDRYVSLLSDGERQRVMVARALAQEPQILVLDEVTSFLDLPRRVQFFQLMAQLARTKNLSIIVSTHELELAVRCADKLLLFDGAALHQGAPEDLILAGDFERVFQSDGVSFDAEAGHFEVRTPRVAVVNLKGTGDQYLWTRRALARRGIGLDTSGESVIVAERGIWTSNVRGHSAESKNIAELIRNISPRLLQ